MMLTKEECEMALTEIEYSLCELEETKTGVVVNCLFDENLETIKQLIEEHFDNPPLTFEELKEGMWVWDNKRKVKLLIAYCYSEDDMGYYNLSNPEDYKYTHIEFEENRFYRKEVQE